MKGKKGVLSPVGKIRQNVALPHIKGTAEIESVTFNGVGSVVIPLKQHIGVPAEPAVKKGDEVFVGTLIGKAEVKMCVPIYSSVSGTVSDIVDYTLGDGSTVKAVAIESDGKMTLDKSVKKPKVSSVDDLINAAKNCGLVGLGGAGFPTYIKFMLPDECKIDTLIINGAECEPYITADYRCCIEDSDNIFTAIKTIKDYMNIDRVIIAIEANKPAAIKNLNEIASYDDAEGNKVEVMKLKTDYPQGAEKILAYTTLKRVIKAGQLPSDVGIMVMNITTVAELGHYLNTGIPLTSRRVTVDGDAIAEPKNVIVPIGTKISDLVEFCGGYEKEPERLIMGGPMMGNNLIDDSGVITKTTNALLAMTADKHLKTTACIHCGRCATKCPMRLNPAAVERALKMGDNEKLAKQNVNYCMECGCCAFVCPAKRPLTQVMRTAKQSLRRQAK